MQHRRTSPAPAPGDAPLTPLPLLDILSGAHRSAVLRAAIQLRVFDALALGPLDAAAVATAVDADARATGILLEALTALDVVAHDDKGYLLTPLSEAFLVTGRPGYIGETADATTHDFLWEGDRRLAEAVRAGGSVIAETDSADEHPFWQVFAQASAKIAQFGGRIATGLLAPWAEGRGELAALDLAAGSGQYGCRLAADFPQARVTLLDWPEVLAAGRGSAERLAVADRVTEIAGDIRTVPYQGPYDLVLMNNVLHTIGEDACGELLRRVAAVLKPDGRVLIQEIAPTGADPRGDGAARLFSALMLVATKEGQVHTPERIREFLATAGLDVLARQQAPHVPGAFFLMAGRGPGS